jgi:predicted transcriptional regulator
MAVGLGGAEGRHVCEGRTHVLDDAEHRASSDGIRLHGAGVREPDVQGGGAPGSRRAAGELEAAVLAELQAAGKPLSPGDVRDRLHADLAYTTVVTILSRLHAKGVLGRDKVGRSFVYAPVADEPGLAARRMARILDAEPDRAAVLARFLDTLATTDAALLRDLLDQR